MDIDFQEDNDPDDEFEEKMKQSYMKHKDSRPNSSRPETASRFRDEHEKNSYILPFQVYSKIASFISSHKVSKSRLAKLVTEYPKIEKFQSAFRDLGLTLSDEEILVIYKDNGSSKSGVIRLSDLYNRIITEEEELNDSSQAKLKEELEKLLQEAPARLHKQKSDSTVRRPITGSVRTLQSAHSSAKTFRPNTASNFPRKNYLKESKAKIENADREIALTVDRCKKEFEYECLHKMGEANEIAQNLEMPTTYRAVKKDDGTTKCHVYMNDQFVDEITLENFVREWRKLKRKQKPAINLPAPKAKLENQGKVNKKTRQDELKKLLLETKELTNKLKDQLKVLEKRGVTYSCNHSSTVVFSNNLF